VPFSVALAALIIFPDTPIVSIDLHVQSREIPSKHLMKSQNAQCESKPFAFLLRKVSFSVKMLSFLPRPTRNPLQNSGANVSQHPSNLRFNIAVCSLERVSAMDVPR
jgi:hypothetical protein